jgi:hypothetical protein
MTYQEYRETQSKQISDFPIFWAFNNDQFKQGIEKVGATPDNKVVGIGAGGYILKKDLPAFIEWSKNKKKTLKTLLNQKKFFYSAVSYELANYEFCITYDYTDTLDALGLKFDDLLDWQKEMLIKAKDMYLGSVV